MLAKTVVLLCAVVAAHGFNLGPVDIIFHLFTRANPTQSQALLPNPISISQSIFSLGRRTIFTIHSYNETVSGNFNAFVARAHLDAEDVNVIAVDWSRGSQFYSLGLGNAPQVGEVIARFINILINDFRYNVNLIRIVGVGLGGHIAGIAGRKVTGEIPHIVSLDPSLVGWTHHPDKLKATDAAVVEVLHVTAGVYGYDFPLGDIDFYPNGGASQVGCWDDIRCSHIYGYAFYAESITRHLIEGQKFVGTACENYAQAAAMQCDGDRDVHFGGPETKENVSGIYTFTTNAVPPFARG